jgi:hypothetical protein
MTGRGLTPGEVAMLKSVFGNTIDYQAVWIHRGRWTMFQPFHTVMTPNGRMYWPECEYEHDFSLVDLAKKAWFIHEGCHLYQYYKLRWNLIVRRCFESNYRYVLDPAKRKLSDYGMEEMGDIAADYYIMKQGYDPGRGYTMAQYQRLLPLT